MFADFHFDEFLPLFQAPLLKDDPAESLCPVVSGAGSLSLGHGLISHARATCPVPLFSWWQTDRYHLSRPPPWPGPRSAKAEDGGCPERRRCRQRSRCPSRPGKRDSPAGSGDLSQRVGGEAPTHAAPLGSCVEVLSLGLRSRGWENVPRGRLMTCRTCICVEAPGVQPPGCRGCCGRATGRTSHGFPLQNVLRVGKGLLLVLRASSVLLRPVRGPGAPTPRWRTCPVPPGWRGSPGTVVRDAGQRWTSAPRPAKGLPRLDTGCNGGAFSSPQAQSVLHLLPSVHTWPLFLLWGEKRSRTRPQSSSNGERE